MNASQSLVKLAPALVKAQGELKAAVFDSQNPFLKNKYASLGAVVDAVRPVFAKHDLAVSQLITGDGTMIAVETILLHSSGEFMGSTVSLHLGDVKGKSVAQEAGSIVTYLRRYALSAIAGVYADEDTDGNAPPVTAPKAAPAVQQPQRKPAPPVAKPVPVPVEEKDPFDMGEEPPAAEAGALYIQSMKNLKTVKGDPYAVVTLSDKREAFCFDVKVIESATAAMEGVKAVEVVIEEGKPDAKGNIRLKLNEVHCETF